MHREEALTVALNVSENVGTPSADRAYIHTSRIATLFMTFCEESALFPNDESNQLRLVIDNIPECPIEELDLRERSSRPPT